MLKGRLSATTQNLCGALTSASALLSGKLSNAPIMLQEKNAIPSIEEQIITADVGYGGLSSVTIAPIPQNYGRVIYNGNLIIV